MFKALPMLRVSLQVLREDAPHATMVLAEQGVFAPETVEDPEEQLHELPAERYRELFQNARARFAKIPGAMSCEPPESLTPRVVPLEELEALDARLGELWHLFSGLEERERRLSDERQSLAQLRQSLAVFDNLDVDLRLFHDTKGFLFLRVGTVPAANLARLREAVGLAGHFLSTFHTSGDSQYVVVAGPQESAEQVDALLRTAGFRGLTIPEEFRDYPERIKQELAGREATLAQETEALEAETRTRRAEHLGELTRACEALHLAAPYAELATRLRGRGAIAVVEGWIPRDDLQQLESALHRQLSSPFVLNTRAPRPEEQGEVPTLTRYGRFLRPFAALVRNYGVPRYGEFDPTILFAVSFVLMFGMMFGDVGHGAVFVLVGLALRRKFPAVVPFFVAAGTSAFLFGFVYGSVFGYKYLLPALWMSPLSDPLLMLELALYWGIGFILLATTLTIYNNLHEGEYGAALFDNKGLAGMALYIAGLYAGFRWMGGAEVGWAEGLGILVPLLVILAYKWHESDSPTSERMLVVGVEGFESIMNYLANTLSFLRVAAFSLNHVALAVAVFTLANMMDTMGHWITVVLGNIFIIVLEGAIVTIQILRLEYYEGFSRFFRGDGREFRPLRYDTRAG